MRQLAIHHGPPREWQPVLTAFLSGPRWRDVERARREAGVRWSDVYVDGDGFRRRLLTEALRAAWSAPAPALLGSAARFEAWANEVSVWSPDEDRREASLWLIATILGREGLAASSAAARAVTLWVPHRPLLPSLLGIAMPGLGGPSPRSHAQHALDTWSRRMVQDPDTRWVDGWSATARTELGQRGPSARTAFFVREATAHTPEGFLAGWALVPCLSEHACQSWGDALRVLLPPAKHPKVYTAPEAGLGFLQVLGAQAASARNIRERERARHLRAALACGWRPAPAESGAPAALAWQRLATGRPQWTKLLLAHRLSTTLPSGPASPRMFRL